MTVSASSILTERFYKTLFETKSVNEAVRRSRWELSENQERRAYFNQTIKLEDWLLPVVYFNGSVDLDLREFTAEEEKRFFAEDAERYRFQGTTYGFVGRNLDILKIEKALVRHNVLLLRGMGGTGKTTLLEYLREWWETTHFAERVFYVEFNDRYEQTGTYHQSGRVARESREFDEACRYYRQALEICVESGDRYSQARTYHQFGMVAQDLREFDEARRCYRQALEIQIEFGDRYNQAGN